MKYEGNLYGKIGRKYVQLIDTTKDIEAKDARIAELEAHQEYQLREEGALRDTIDRLKADLTEELAKVERLREALNTAKESMAERRGYADMWEYKYGETWNKEDPLVNEALAATDPTSSKTETVED